MRFQPKSSWAQVTCEKSQPINISLFFRCSVSSPCFGRAIEKISFICRNPRTRCTQERKKQYRKTWRCSLSCAHLHILIGDINSVGETTCHDYHLLAVLHHRSGRKLEPGDPQHCTTNPKQHPGGLSSPLHSWFLAVQKQTGGERRRKWNDAKVYKLWLENNRKCN